MADFYCGFCDKFLQMVGVFSDSCLFFFLLYSKSPPNDIFLVCLFCIIKNLTFGFLVLLLDIIQLPLLFLCEVSDES